MRPRAVVAVGIVIVAVFVSIAATFGVQSFSEHGDTPGGYPEAADGYCVVVEAGQGLDYGYCVRELPEFPDIPTCQDGQAIGYELGELACLDL